MRYVMKQSCRLAAMVIAGAILFAAAAHAGVVWVGMPAPELSIDRLLNAPSNVPPTLSGNKGRTLVIEFFSINCPKCHEAMPHFNELAREMKDEPVTFIALTNEDETAVRKYMAEVGMSAYVGLDPDWSMWGEYAVPGVPMAVVINPKGIVAALVHPDELNPEMLRTIMNGRTPNVKLTELYEDPNAPETLRNRAFPLMQVEVRPAKPGDRMAIWKGDEFQARAATLADLLSLITNIEAYRFVSDDLLLDARYDVRIVPPQPDSSMTDAMLRAIIEQMAQPRLKEVERTVPVYVLRSRPAGAMHLVRGTDQPAIKGGDGHVIATNVPIQQIVANLQRDLRAPVIDETGLEGGWNFEIKWDVNDPQSVVAALRDQLGLDVRLEQRPMPVILVKRGD